MNVYLITDYTSVNPVRLALDAIKDDLRLTISQVDYFNIDQDLFPQILSFITNADIVIADISNERPNSYYEIGVAHGIGKPVIFVSQTDKFNSFSLLTYNFYRYESDPDGIKKMTFFLKNILASQIQMNRYLPKVQNRGQRFEGNLPSKELNAISGMSAEERHTEFEKWVGTMLIGISGFDVQHGNNDSTREYDFVIWNNTTDADFSLLGNPIPVEAKSTENIDAGTIDKIASKAMRHGFKSIILITLAKRTPRITSQIVELKKTIGISFLVIDQIDLLSITSPQDFFKVVKRSLRELFVS